MKADFIKHMETQVHLTESDLALLDELLVEKTYSKGDFLLEAGNICSEIIYLVSGCVRMFYEVNGEEKTTYFYTQKEFVGAYESYTRQIPSDYYFQAISPVGAVLVNKKGADQMLAMSGTFEILARVFMEQELVVYQKMIASFITLTPEERYVSLLNTRPDLIQQIPQHYIASYLGVSAETLSRIKRRLYQKERKS